MYFTNDQIQQIRGFILFNDFGAFVYCCKHCECECLSGTELEEHILLEHQEDVKKNIKHIYVSDGALASTPIQSIVIASNDQTFKPMSIELNQNLVTAEMLSNNKDDTNDAIEFQAQDSSKSPGTNRMQKKRPPPKIYQCELCPDRSFSTLSIVKRHMKVHIGNKVRKFCSICRRVSYDYEKHMQVKHTGRPFKCEFCDASFGTNSNRVIHTRTHTNERPFLCATCGKSFNSQSTKRKHELRVHLKQLPHSCRECDRKFLLPSQLHEHILAMHSNVRSFICEACGKCFFNGKYLRKHKLTHGEKIHSCRCCDKLFKTTDARRWHEKTVHNAV